MQYIFKVLSFYKIEKTQYMNVNDMKSYKYLVLQFIYILLSCSMLRDAVDMNNINYF